MENLTLTLSNGLEVAMAPLRFSDENIDLLCSFTELKQTKNIRPVLTGLRRAILESLTEVHGAEAAADLIRKLVFNLDPNGDVMRAGRLLLGTALDEEAGDDAAGSGV